MSEPIRVDDFTWELPPDYRDGMRVPGRIFATEELFAKALEDRAAEQVGVQIHDGYGQVETNIVVGTGATTGSGDHGSVAPWGAAGGNPAVFPTQGVRFLSDPRTTMRVTPDR